MSYCVEADLELSTTLSRQGVSRVHSPSAKCCRIGDAELATLYGVDTKVLLQAVRRNSERFPEDFMMQLTAAEWAALRSQSVTLKRGRGQHRKYLPYVFTEQGVAMLSSVLKSARAIAINMSMYRHSIPICGHSQQIA